jgi:hypothetical protein
MQLSPRRRRVWAAPNHVVAGGMRELCFALVQGSDIVNREVPVVYAAAGGTAVWSGALEPTAEVVKSRAWFFRGPGSAICICECSRLKLILPIFFL